MKRLAKRSTQVLVDVLVLAAAFWLAFMLRFEGDVPNDMLRRLFFLWPYVVAFQYLCLVLFKVPRFAWRYVGLREVTRIGLATATAAVFLLVARFIGAELRDFDPRFRYALVPVGVVVIDFLLSFLGVTGARALRRFVGEQAETRARARADRIPTMLVGAGEAGLAVVKEIASRPDLGMSAVGFLDDDPEKIGQVIHGVSVLGSTKELRTLCETKGAQQVLITIAHAAGKDIRRIRGLAEAANLPAKIVPAVHEIVGGKVGLTRIRDVAIEDLLRRDPIRLDEAGISEAIRGRVVMVTGAGGSIGSELCRQIIRFQPARLVMVERAENRLFHIHRELQMDAASDVQTPCIADICDEARIESLFREYQPEVVFHAAAHKHVPMMEWNALEAVKNNVLGTRLVAEAAARHSAESFVMISTDKAVRPTSVMGATKRAAELLVQSLAASSETRFVSVRFGNVLGSEGSVVPIFREQIAAGGPVTVTHAEMTRYFMTIPEACQLVMQAGTMGGGNEIFLLNMGEPVKIVDLARDLISLSGLTPDEDVEIQFTGLRPGEKLFEELCVAGDLAKTFHPDISVERGEPIPSDRVHAAVEQLTVAVQGEDETAVREILDRLIPEPTELLPDHRAADLG